MSKKIAVSLYTQGEFGVSSNTKSNAARALYQGLKPTYTFCRNSTLHKKGIKHIIPMGNFIPKIITFVNIKTKGKFNLNMMQLKFLDFFSRLKNDPSQIQVFHPYTFRKTVLARKKHGKITVNLMTSVPTKDMDNMLAKEYKKFGLTYHSMNADNLKNLFSSDYIITYSTFATQKAVAAGFDKEKVLTCSNATDPTVFKPDHAKKSKASFIVLCVADFTINKGLYYLIKAWKSLDLMDAELWILGSMDAQTQKVFEEFKLDTASSIKILGHRKPLDYYQKADVFVLPTLCEGSAQVNYEAMACGLPVITTHNAGSVARNNKEGILVEPQNADAIAAAVQRYYNNPKLVGEHGEAARKRIVDGYSWKHYGERMAQAIATIKKKEFGV